MSLSPDGQHIAYVTHREMENSVSSSMARPARNTMELYKATHSSAPTANAQRPCREHEKQLVVVDRHAGIKSTESGQAFRWHWFQQQKRMRLPARSQPRKWSVVVDGEPSAPEYDYTGGHLPASF